MLGRINVASRCAVLTVAVLLRMGGVGATAYAAAEPAIAAAADLNAALPEVAGLFAKDAGKSVFQILGGAVAYMMLAWYIPSLAASLYSGTVALSLAEFAYTGRGVGAWAATAGAGGVAAGAAAMEGSRAVVEATRLGRDTAASSGGGIYGVVTGALDAGGVLAREGVRAAVPTLTGSKSRVSGKIAEELAIRTPSLAGYGRSDAAASSRGGRAPASEPAPTAPKNGQRQTT